MKKIIEYFVDNSIVVNLLTLLIIAMGTFSLFSLNKETFPNIDFNYVVVTNMFPGTAPEDVEKLLSIDLERALKEVDGIEELNVLSSEGGAIVSIKVDPEYDTDKVTQDVKDALDRIADLPEDVEEPIVTSISNKNRAIMSVAIFGDDENTLRIKAKKLRDLLELDPRVTKAQMTGYRDELIDIQVKIEELEKYDMSLSEIVQAIRDRQTNISAGNIKNPNQEKLIRTLVENETVEEVGNIVIRSNDIGDTVLVKDLAQVSLVLKDKTREDRSSGELAIFLDVSTKTSSDVLESADFIKSVFSEQAEILDFKYKIYNDFSYYVKRRLGVLSQNGIQGIFLVIICLLMFMNLRISIITALGAPFAFLVAFSLMDSMDITINLISMFGLIMVLGMLVDDSIIVAEQYYQNLELGMKPKEAAKQAAFETLGPVTATVLTTMVAFGSLFFMDGIMGKFLWPVPAVVIIALAASWLECFIILPGHLADFAKALKKEDIEKDTWYKPILNFYEKILNWTLHHGKTTVAFFILIFFLSVGMITTMRFELFPSDDVTNITVNIKGNVGTPFDQTNKELIKLEKEVYKVINKDELSGVRTITGYQSFEGGRSKSGSHYGSILVELTMQDLRERKTKELVKVISDALKIVVDSKFDYAVDIQKNGPPQGKAVNVELFSDDLALLLKASNELKDHLSSVDGIISTELDYEIGKNQILVKINEKEARRLGVTNKQIALELRRAFEGEVATTVKKSDDDMDILVRLNETSRANEEVLKKIRVVNSQGRRVLLNKIASFEEVPGAFVIRRYNRKRTMEVSGDIDLKKTTSLNITKQITPFVESLLKKYPSITYRMGGESKDTMESLDSFKKALVASVFIIFIMLVIQFSSMAQPIIILSAVPFGLVGVVFSFKILGLPFGFMALMGMLGLVGVVINDSIVLVTFINRTLKLEGHTYQSLIKATLSRFRPVVLTTITTVVGLLPVAHMPGGDPFLKPMATSFAYGLLFSSAITLIFVPACYKIYIDFVDKRTNKKLAVEG